MLCQLHVSQKKQISLSGLLNANVVIHLQDIRKLTAAAVLVSIGLRASLGGGEHVFVVDKNLHKLSNYTETNS